MKNLIDFKKFAINESEENKEMFDRIPQAVLDNIIDEAEGEALLVIKEKIPYLYSLLSARAQSRGLDLDRFVSVKSRMRMM